MKTKELIEWLKTLFGYCIVFSHKMPSKDEEKNDLVLQEIIKRLEEHEEMKKQRDELLKALIDSHVILSEVVKGH